MKILHLCLGCFYIDNYTYQENMIPKFHKKMGHDVQIVASTLSFDTSGNACNIKAGTYVNEYGIKVTRLPYKNGVSNKIGRFLRIYEGLALKLEEVKPDLLFIHGCQFCDIKHVVRFARNNNVTIYVDNHADFSNSARNYFSKNIMHKIIWKHCAQSILPYTTKFYGVLPARVDFLKNMYDIPQEKIELLVMGADDDLINDVRKENKHEEIRQNFNIEKDDFLIITGGKIDHAKEQVITLLDVVHALEDKKIKCIVFGSIVDDMKDKVLSFCDNQTIFYAGWLNNRQQYELLSVSDLAVYPGRHSVLWEQSVGMGLPMIVKYWEGTTHVDVGGNIKFLYNDTKEELLNAICNIIKNKKEFEKMKSVAVNKGIEVFSYENIAKRSINYK